ncbi:MAG: serine hydrolase [Bacteroidia bacterium]|nr:serine hydrolase [Bacteroidia bacterium]
MYSIKEGLYILFIPLAIGLLLLGISVGFPEKPEPDIHIYQSFEVTVWGDSASNQNNGIPIVHLSTREAVVASMILVQNQTETIPFKNLDEKSFHVITLGNPVPAFEKYIRFYTQTSTQQVRMVEEVNTEELSYFNPVIVVLNLPQQNRYIIHQFLENIRKHSEVVVVNFGNYEILKPFAGYPTILQAPNSHTESQEVAAQVLFGGIGTSRSLPDYMATELGLSKNYFTTQNRLAYSYPEYAGISSDSLAKIDAIIAEGIQNFAMPGCQVLVVKSGQVIYHKAFGYHTYDRRRPVKEDDLYDLASITKVASTTLASMKLYEEKKLSLDDHLSEYFQDETYDPAPVRVYDTIPYRDFVIFMDSVRQNPEGFTLKAQDTIRYRDSLLLVGRWENSNKGRKISPLFKVSLSDLLTHTSGLQASLPIVPYQRYINSSLFSRTYDQNYSVPVANRFYLRNNYLDSLWNDTKRLRPDSARYLYSCVNMILMQRVVDSINRKPINEYVEETFYEKLGLQTMCYNPRERFDPERLVPTASDRWRGQVLCGTVHDPTAALMGGVSGNAGLFSNASDLAVLAQMLLNKGQYGGERFFQDTTVERFTNRVRGHRGLGFDKPPRSTNYIIAESASLSTYGHTGFTGTCVWVDPENDLIFVFLSNRIHPSVNNTRINEMRIRQRVHQVVYNAMGIPSRAPSFERKDEENAADEEVILAVRN